MEKLDQLNPDILPTLILRHYFKLNGPGGIRVNIEVYLEFRQTSIIELFYENSKGLLAITIFTEKLHDRGFKGL